MTVQHLGRSPEQISKKQRSNTSSRLLRLPQIIGQKEVTFEQAEENRKAGKSPKTPRPYIEPRVPVSRASWWAGVKSLKYPRPVKLGRRTTAWKESDIVALINKSDEDC